jgi:copper transport protein
MRMAEPEPCGRRLLVALTLAGALLLLPAQSAEAHAILISANPPPNIGLGTPPDAVTLRFSEPLRVPPSSIRVLDESGRNLVRSLRRISTDPQSMRAALPTLERGVYRVEWKAISTLDGHTISGSYQFGVGQAPSGAPPESEEGPLAGAGVAGILLRVLQDGSLLLAVGVSLVLLLTRRIPSAIRSSLQALAPWVAIAAIAFPAASVAAESLAAAGWSWSGITAFLSAGVAGWGRTASVLLAILAGAALGRASASLALVCSAAGLAAVGISGHAASSSLPVPAMAANAAHAVSAGLGNVRQLADFAR